ncbi:MAG: hypothetical protein ABSE49_05925 [Polyangiaceae bacterium]|jgi:hypothetical protein
MRSVAPRLLAIASIAIATSLSPPLYAQSDADRATARQLGQDGETALDAKDYKSAEDAFRRANRLVHAPTLELGLARALAGLGKFVESQETYNRIVREGVAPGSPQVFHDAVEAAKKEVDSVGPHIGGVNIVVQAAGGGDVSSAKVLLDGQPVNNASLGVRRAIDPGSHVLSVTADGFKPAELRFDVAEGGSVNAPITLEKDPNAVVAPPVPPPVPPPVDSHTSFAPPTPPPAPAPPPPSSFPGYLPWTVMGLGGAGLVLGAVAGGIAIGKHSDLAKVCGGGTCNTDQQSAVDSYHSMGTLSTVGFVVGGVGVAAGVVLLLVKPSAPQVSPATTGSSPLTVTPVVGLGSLGAVGTF